MHCAKVSYDTCTIYPLRMDIVKKDVFFQNSKEVSEEDSSKEYVHFEKDDFSKKDTFLTLTGCKKIKMIAYHSDSSIQTRNSICSCSNCILSWETPNPSGNGSQ